jgi:hypothetical protein
MEGEAEPTANRLSLIAQWTSPDTIGADELFWRGVLDPTDRALDQALVGQPRERTWAERWAGRTDVPVRESCFPNASVGRRERVSRSAGGPRPRIKGVVGSGGE